MTIKELLKQYFATPETNTGLPEGLWKIVGPWQLASKLRKDLDNNPVTQLFASFMKAYKLNYNAQDIVDFCTKLNINTDTEVLNWIYAINDANKNINIEELQKIIEGNVTIDINLKPMTGQKLTGIIKANFPNLTDFELSDVNYQVTDLEGLKEICNLNPSSSYKWKNDSRDCDDIARIFRAWLSKNNLGNMTIAYCEVNAFYDKKLVYAHAIILAIISDGNDYILKFVEPQNGIISDVKGFDPPGLTANRYEVRKLMF